MRTGYVVFAHGSSVESANEAVRKVAAEMARKGNLEPVVAAFLEGGRPNLMEAISNIAGQGVARVVVAPYFLTLGLHLQRDLPVLIEEAKKAHRGLEIEVTAPLDGHPAMIEALLDRVAGSIETPVEETPVEGPPAAERR
jgi:sirohydrochlorin ferrochelatase